MFTSYCLPSERMREVATSLCTSIPKYVWVIPREKKTRQLDPYAQQVCRALFA
jgi:hypothetical protein